MRERFFETAPDFASAIAHCPVIKIAECAAESAHCLTRRPDEAL
jgi:hypothetical protein